MWAAGRLMRGDFVTIAIQGDFGKPRPALVIQADPFNEHATVTVLPVTSTLAVAPLLRVSVEPGPGSGLQKPSQVMVDKDSDREARQGGASLWTHRSRDAGGG
jgi:Growth inhibitor